MYGAYGAPAYGPHPYGVVPPHHHIPPHGPQPHPVGYGGYGARPPVYRY